jgi:hypothetical protein
MRSLEDAKKIIRIKIPLYNWIQQQASRNTPQIKTLSLELELKFHRSIKYLNHVRSFLVAHAAPSFFRTSFSHLFIESIPAVG